MEGPESRKRVVAKEDRRHRAAAAPQDPQFYPDVKGAETKHPEPAH